jgi:uncharacterized protein (TIRG00374 family)
MLKLQKRRPAWNNYLRLLGIVLLGVLLWKSDLRQIWHSLSGVVWPFLLPAIALNIPLISIKAGRWRYLMQVQGIRYGLTSSILAYFGSIFIGYLTPGRLGEFVRVFHVSHDCDVRPVRAFVSILLDRLFDLYALLATGAIALWSLAAARTVQVWLGLVILITALTLPLVFLLNDRVFGWVSRWGLRLGRPGAQLFDTQGWLVELHSGLRALAPPTLATTIGLTVIAYGMFYSQCYLVALSVGLKAGFADVSYAVALGSLITLLPISISGIGTRDAAIVAYLSSVAVPPEAALSFSLLVFLTSCVAGSLMGAIAWWIKPAPAQWKRPAAIELSDDQV